MLKVATCKGVSEKMKYDLFFKLKMCNLTLNVSNTGEWIQFNYTKLLHY